MNVPRWNRWAAWLVYGVAAALLFVACEAVALFTAGTATGVVATELLQPAPKPQTVINNTGPGDVNLDQLSAPGPGGIPLWWFAAAGLLWVAWLRREWLVAFLSGKHGGAPASRFWAAVHGLWGGKGSRARAVGGVASKTDRKAILSRLPKDSP